MKQFLTSLTFVVVILVVLWSCGTEDKKNESKSIEKKETKKEANFFEIFSNKNLFTCGDTIVLSLHYEKKTRQCKGLFGWQFYWKFGKF